MNQSPADRAISVAVEHVSWARGAGYAPGELIAGLGAEVPADPSWDDAVWALARAWDVLPKRQEEKIEQGRQAQPPVAERGL